MASWAQGDVIETYAVRVNNLKHEVTEEQLRAYFAGYGDIESVAVIKRGGTKRHGYVNYYSKSNATLAAGSMNGARIEGKRVECKATNEPRKTARKRPPPPHALLQSSVHPISGALPKSQAKRKPRVQPAHVARRTYSVKLSNLASKTTKKSLLSMLREEYEISPNSVRIIHCPRQPNHGFMTFISKDDASEAAENLHCSMIDGCRIKAKLLQSEEPLIVVNATSDDIQRELCSKSKSRAPPTSGTPRRGPSCQYISCSSPVASIISTKYKKDIDSIEKEHEVRIRVVLSPVTSIEISGYKRKVENAKESLKAIVEKVKERICYKKFDLPFCCVPLFEQDEVMKRFKKIETERAVIFQVQRNRMDYYVNIESFSAEIKQCFNDKSQGGDSIPYSELTLYSMEEEENVQWFYESDCGNFEEYTSDHSREIEQMFQTKSTHPLFIRKFYYTFDFKAMTQSNEKTNRARAIKRQVEYKRMLSIQVSGMSESLGPPVREFNDVFKNMTITKECQLYKETNQEKMMSRMKNYFVTSQLLLDGKLKLTGVRGYVERVHLVAEQEKLSEREAQMHGAIGVTESDLPPHWTPQTEEVSLDVVKRGSKEWMDELEKIRMTLKGVTIVRLERVQNKWLWERYSFAKKRMDKRNRGHINEKHLFHGTRTTTPEDVYKSEKGVDFRYSREGLWGTGAYFAVNASYSDKYAYSTPGGKQMFICKVLTGDAYDAGSKHDSSLKQPPLKPGQNAEGKRYDSVKGHTNGSDVYIVYDHEKVYPAYLVTYRSIVRTLVYVV